MNKKRKSPPSKSGKSKKAEQARSEIPSLLKNMELSYLDLSNEPERLSRLKVIADGLPDNLVVGLADRLRLESDQIVHNPQAFFERYKISPAEAALLKSLAQGITVTEHAKSKDVSVNTVRTQVRRLLEKTGATSQIDLVRIFLSHRTLQYPQ